MLQIRIRSVLLALAFGLAAACATPVSEADLTAELTRAAKPFAGLGTPSVIPIYAESKMVAMGHLAEARTNPESSFSRRLGSKLARAHSRRVPVVVGGPYSQLSDRVLTNAIALGGPTGLRGLRVVYVSSDQPSAALADAARLAQVRLYYRALP